MAETPPIADPIRNERSGSRAALDRFTDALYAELRRIAAGELARGNRGVSLQTTALVNEAWLRLAQQRHLDRIDRNHFLAIACRVVRRTLVDHARERGAHKRGGAAQRVTLADLERPGRATIDLIAFDDALTRLRRLDERQARVVELRYFTGISVDEVAAVLGVSPRTVDGDWRVARAWLARELQP